MENHKFSKDDKVLIKHGPLSYLAKILEMKQSEELGMTYLVHYIYWKKSYDEWVPEAMLQEDNETDPEKRRALRRGKGAIPTDPNLETPPEESELREKLDKVVLEFSKKDIPIPGEIEYLKQLTNANEKFLRKLCWQIHFINEKKEKGEQGEQGENYGIKSGKAPPQEAVREIKGFIEDLCDGQHKVQTLHKR